MPRVEVNERVDPVDFSALDPETLDSSMHYRFVHPRSFAKRRSQGYELVMRDESGVRFLNEDGRVAPSADNLLRKGDSVLMSCRKSVFNERRKRSRAYAQARLTQTESRFATRARKAGVRPLVGDEGE